MNYATAGGVAAADDHVRALTAAAVESRAAGDHELAAALASHASQVQRCPQLGVGKVTLELRDRHVPVADYQRHIRRGGKPTPAASGRTAAVPARAKTALQVQIESASAACRALIGQASAAKVARLLASRGRRAAPVARVEDGVDIAARQGRLFGMPHARP